MLPDGKITLCLQLSRTAVATLGHSTTLVAGIISVSPLFQLCSYLLSLRQLSLHHCWSNPLMLGIRRLSSPPSRKPLLPPSDFRGGLAHPHLPVVTLPPTFGTTAPTHSSLPSTVAQHLHLSSKHTTLRPCHLMPARSPVRNVMAPPAEHRPPTNRPPSPLRLFNPSHSSPRLASPTSPVCPI